MPNLALVISVLIPTYNHVVVNLVNELSNQIKQSQLTAEIIVLDDGSTDAIKQLNEAIAIIPGVHYEELPVNIGRAAIRNELSTRAHHPYLLYLDADSTVVDDDFLKAYVASIDGQNVLVGGRVYRSERPPEEYLLHWRYGRQRETQSLVQRQQRPASFFHSNNVLIPKSLECSFTQAEKGYGYEDLALGQTLLRDGVKIVHLENPVLHDQLDTNRDFIYKHNQALVNLAASLRAKATLGTRLGSIYLKMRKLPLGVQVMGLFKGLETGLKERLLKGQAPLWYFDLYRLLLLHHLYESDTE